MLIDLVGDGSEQMLEDGTGTEEYRRYLNGNDQFRNGTAQEACNQRASYLIRNSTDRD